jgi:hypothetical protein
VDVEICSPRFLQRKFMPSGRKYFYSLGQRARSKGWTKEQGIKYYALESSLPHALIYYDKGYRGLSL